MVNRSLLIPKCLLLLCDQHHVFGSEEGMHRPHNSQTIALVGCMSSMSPSTVHVRLCASMCPCCPLSHSFRTSQAVDATIKSLEKAREKAGMTHALAPDNAAPTPASDSAGLNSSQVLHALY